MAASFNLLSLGFIHADLMPFALFPNLRLYHRQPVHMSEIPHRRRASLQASLAEMVLLNRLRARTRTDLELDTLQRGASIIELTAKHWFADAVVG